MKEEECLFCLQELVLKESITIKRWVHFKGKCVTSSHIQVYIKRSMSMGCIQKEDQNLSWWNEWLVSCCTSYLHWFENSIPFHLKLYKGWQSCFQLGLLQKFSIHIVIHTTTNFWKITFFMIESYITEFTGTEWEPLVPASGEFFVQMSVWVLQGRGVGAYFCVVRPSERK